MGYLSLVMEKYEVLYEIITEKLGVELSNGYYEKIIYILFGMLAWWSCEDENSLIGPEGVFSEYTDSRDGKIYRCVTIGDQTWMAEEFGLPSAFRKCRRLLYTYREENFGYKPH